LPVFQGQAAISPRSSSPTTAPWVDFAHTQTAVRSQYWMLAVTVGFTTLGLWLLSEANG
jgi:hypothetical protein